MARGFVIGLFLSAALTLVVCKKLDRRVAAAGAAPVAAAKGTDAPSAPDSTAELTTARAENESLRKQISDAKAAREKAALDAAAKAAKGPNPWTKVAKGLVGFLRKVKEKPTDSSDAAQNSQDLFIEMLGLMGKIAKERGVSMEEALLTPEGLPALIAAAFEGVDPPLTDDEQAALAKLASDVEAGWNEIDKAKDGMSRLEQRLAMTRNGLDAAAALKGALLPDHAEMASELESMGLGMMGSMGTGTFYQSGPHDKVRDEFAKHWAKSLKFDESQAGAFAPIVEEYMRSVDAATEAFTRDTKAGIKGGESKMVTARLEAQIAAQKKIEASFPLTKEQKAALNGWTTNYLYWGGAAAEPTDPNK